MATTTEHVNALTFDLACGAVDEVAALLDLLALHALRATLFAPGAMARRYPALMRRIVAGGHELASQGYHPCAATHTRFQFRRDIVRSKGVLEDSTGCAVLGYRAPACAMACSGCCTERGTEPGARCTEHCPARWALDVLYQQGYRYRAGGATGACAPYTCATYPNGPHGMLDLPLATLRLGPCQLAWRAGPAWLARPMLRWLRRAGAPPAVVRLSPAQLCARPAQLAALARHACWDRVDRVFPVLP